MTQQMRNKELDLVVLPTCYILCNMLHKYCSLSYKWHEMSLQLYV